MEGLELIKYKGTRKVLETFLKFKGRQFTINELSKTTKVPFGSLWRLLKKWESAGIIETNVIGKSRVVRLHESEYTKRLLELLKLSVSPQAFTAEALKKELKGKSIKEAYLFGSVAKKNEKLESDIDLAILAGKKFDANKLMFEVYEKYGTKVVPLIFDNKKELDKFLKDKEKERII
jgi:predicted nucleotidyltransferase